MFEDQCSILYFPIQTGIFLISANKAGPHRHLLVERYFVQRGRRVLQPKSFCCSGNPCLKLLEATSLTNNLSSTVHPAFSLPPS